MDKYKYKNAAKNDKKSRCFGSGMYRLRRRLEEDFSNDRIAVEAIIEPTGGGRKSMMQRLWIGFAKPFGRLSQRSAEDPHQRKQNDQPAIR